METVWQKLGRARNRGVPIIVLASPDLPATLQGLRDKLNGSAPVIHWNMSSGLTDLNKLGKEALREITDKPAAVTNPISMLLAVTKAPDSTIIVAEDLGACLLETGTKGAAVATALLALRDPYKTTSRTFILLEASVPQLATLTNDILVIEEPLPDREALSTMLDRVAESSSQELDAKTRDAAVDAVSGLSLFAAEQASYLSLYKTGLDLPKLWDRKRAMIGQTPGLSVRADRETFKDVGGVANVKSFVKKLVKGKYPPKVILFVDEIEKALAGAGGDSSGVSQDFMGVLLTWLQDKGVSGMIFVGAAGSAKSMVAKCAGTEAGCPTVTLDLGGMKAQYVGQSEGRIRQALKVIDAVGGDRVLAIATCNNIVSLPPELRRRFTFGTFFFDLPTTGERKVIWDLYLPKYGLSGDIPNDTGWTGAEIKQCCVIADATGASLAEAAQVIVPVAKTDRERIERLRQMADGVFISASYPGPYRADAPDNRSAAGRRSILAE